MNEPTGWTLFVLSIMVIPALLSAQGMGGAHGTCPMWGMGGIGMVMWLAFWLLLIALMVTALFWMLKQIKKA
jgi:hypothetical protein